MRRKVIAGNWKMNMLPADTINFIEGLAPLVKDSENEVILCVSVQKICTGKKRVHIQEKFLDKC